MSNIITNLKPEVINFPIILPRINKKGYNYLTRRNFASFMKNSSLARLIQRLDVKPFEEAVRTYLQIPEMIFGEGKAEERIKRGNYKFQVQIQPSTRAPYQKEVIQEFLDHLSFKVQESLDEKRPWNIITNRRYKYYDVAELVEKISSLVNEKSLKRPGISITPIRIKDHHHLFYGVPNDSVEEENIFRYFSGQHALNGYEAGTKAFKIALEQATKEEVQKALEKNPDQTYFEVLYTSWGGQKLVHPAVIKSNPWTKSYKNLLITPGLEREYVSGRAPVSKDHLGILYLMDYLARLTDYDEPGFQAALTHTDISRKTFLDLNPMIKNKRLRVNEIEPRKRLLLSADGIEKVIGDEVKTQEEATKRINYKPIRLA